MTARTRVIVVAAATITAFWPTWRWYARRLADGSDEKWGLVAIALALTIAVARRRSTSVPSLAGLGFAVAVSAALHVVTTPLLRAVPALVGVALLISAAAYGRRLQPGTAALLLLALPLEATLQFYAGHPLRVAATQIAAGLLGASGLAVSAAGTLLVWRGDTIGVDPACSGIQMLWVALLAAAACAAWRGFALRPLAASLAVAALLVIAGNGVRVAALFVKEARLVRWPEWTHEAVGLAVFAAVLLLLLAVLDHIGPPRPVAIEGALDVVRGLPAYIALCAVAVLVPLLPAPHPRTDAGAFAGWPAELDGVPLRPVPLSAGDARFARDFPGRIGRFTDGERGVLLRWLPAATRQLHPAADCFRGSGYAIAPRPSRIDAGGRRWACLEAVRGSERLTVCERIFDARGGSWTDTSSWWWAATLGRAAGPYWAVTVVEPAIAG